jgi:serine/threonine protein phosphatase 1
VTALFAGRRLLTKPAPSGPRGHRAYAIGDVHGRLDLLETLLARIEADVNTRPRRRTSIIFLGDLIDRGPSSAGVIERLRTFRPSYAKPVFLMGNHEEVLLRVTSGEAALIPSWLRFGGAETLASYGLNAATLSGLSNSDAVARVRDAIPEPHLEFISTFADTVSFGDYLFVHAGIRPGVELSEQSQTDLRWIREPFLENEEERGFIVVHGHTISPRIQSTPNRIGIDTGAFYTGVLTAVAIEGGRRWFLQTGEGNVGDDPLFPA